ncbi:glycosyltransferase family 4 protein [Winogradskyella sp. DF17]|uniref:Glycosyltransferase family 4 protein n=1 Tax=Winogradskyella pelagia TaxID=2819984 RepID=A0ABS3T1R8_9FLAO|nr:glycosyltransferase family 4 protein [Winogradskyella sp. DF17]MBO3116690.1 glycosyltransferase family 4 protein [Winogradskyella sp. DF17]
MKSKVHIIGPIGDVGGRELETGFIAKTLISDGYDVHITSTINYTDDSQLFGFVDKKQVSQLNQLILQKNLWFRFWAYLSYLRGNKNKLLSDYCSNAVSRKTGYRFSAVKILKAMVDSADLVVLCAQISSTFIKEIVEYGFVTDKPVVIRTSSMILESDRIHKSWLEKVTYFIHHSESNAKRLSFLQHHKYKIIDQCTFRENEMLAIEPACKFQSLLFIGRLAPEKGVLELVEYFKRYGSGLSLSLIGNGPLHEELVVLCKAANNISLKGFVSQNDIVEQIRASDAIIIASIGESGPLVGLEAMASARLVISTSVGAMPERLAGLQNQFWFNIYDEESFKQMLNMLRSLTLDQIETIALENRKRYLARYKREAIENLYKKVIFRLQNPD